MKIKVLSDLHCEFSYFDLAGDKNTTLILAGDIFVGTKALREGYIPKWASEFKYVLYVLGNHEYYKHNIDTLPRKIKDRIKELKLDNVYLLDDEVVELDGVQFAGTTLWTDLNSGDPMTKLVVQSSMNDFRQIRVGSNYRKFNLADWLALHTGAMYFLNSIDYTKPTVVITHHAPHVAGVDTERYGNYDNKLNHAYYTDLSEFIAEKQPLMWVFGHTHKRTQFMIGDTTVYSNPRGYVSDKFNYETTGFDPTEVICIGE